MLFAQREVRRKREVGRQDVHVTYQEALALLEEARDADVAVVAQRHAWVRADGTRKGAARGGADGRRRIVRQAAQRLQRALPCGRARRPRSPQPALRRHVQLQARLPLRQPQRGEVTRQVGFELLVQCEREVALLETAPVPPDAPRQRQHDGHVHDEHRRQAEERHVLEGQLVIHDVRSDDVRLLDDEEQQGHDAEQRELPKRAPQHLARVPVRRTPAIEELERLAQRRHHRKHDHGHQ